MTKIFHDAKNKRIDFLDERFYTNDNENFYPSVTTILDVYPKGYGFIQWLKDLGNNAEQVVQRAAEQGTNIHNAIDRYLTGEKLEWLTEGKTEANYTLEEWLMVLKFVEFWTTFKPEIIASEENMLSETLGYGGTLDLICKIGDKIWLIDYKSGNAIYKSYEFQVAAYATMWNEQHPEQKIDHTGIMHLKAMTRGADKSGKYMQGKGWQLKPYERHYTESFKIFQYVHSIWKEENPNPKPKNMVYPDSVQLIISK